MVWFKVDDALAFNMKAIGAGNAALGLWVRAGSWSMQQLSDGFVPVPIVAALGGSTADAAALVDVGLWEDAGGGYQFHDWAEYQPTRATVLAEREAKQDASVAGNHKRWHENRGVVDPRCPLCDPGTIAPAIPAGIPRPVPSRPEGLTLTTESSHVVDARHVTDSKLPPVLEALAAQAGLTSVPAVVAAIAKHTGRDVTPEVAVGIARHLLGKAKGYVRAPQRYVTDAIARSPLEVQKHIDDAGLAA